MTNENKNSNQGNVRKNGIGGWIVIGILCLIGYVYITSLPAPTSREGTPVAELFDAYRSNEIAAKKEYELQKRKYHGEVLSVNVIGDFVNLNFKTSDYTGFVACKIAKKDEQEVANISAGDIVTVEGEVRGYEEAIRDLTKIIDIKPCHVVTQQ